VTRRDWGSAAAIAAILWWVRVETGHGLIEILSDHLPRLFT
jgi:hypothetical protein